MQIWNWILEIVLRIYGYIFDGDRPFTQSTHDHWPHSSNIRSLQNIGKTSIYAAICFVGSIYGGPMGGTIGGMIGGLTAFGMNKWNKNLVFDKIWLFVEIASIFILDVFSILLNVNHSDFYRTVTLVTFLPTIGSIIGGSTGAIAASILGGITAHKIGN